MGLITDLRSCSFPWEIFEVGEWGSEQPNLVVNVPVYCRGVGLDDPSIPTTLCF